MVKTKDPDSIEKEFVKIGKSIDRGISLLIYADPGVGKTTLATTLPVGETLIINTEAGLGPVLGTDHVIFNMKRDLTQVDSLYKYLRTEKHPFKYVVLDNLSEFEEWLIIRLTDFRSKDFAELKEYGDAAFKMSEYTRLFRDLVDSGITVVFNAWEQNITVKNDSSGEVITKICPKMFKSITLEVCGIVDAVGRLEKYDKTGDRWIRFHPQKNLIAKCQFKGLDECEPADLMHVLKKLYSHNYGEDTK